MARKKTLEEKLNDALNEVQDDGSKLSGTESESLDGVNAGINAGNKVSKTKFPTGSSGESKLGKLKGSEYDDIGDIESGVSAGNKVSKTKFPEASSGMGSVGKLKEQIEAVLGEELSLSEDAKQKFTGLFEAAVIARANQAIIEHKASLQEKFDDELLGAIENISEQVDSYVTYATKEWAADNKIAIEKGVRTELAESFIAGMHSLFTEHYITVPEGKEDLVESLSDKVDTLESKYNSVIKSQMIKENEIAELKRTIVFGQVVEGMAESQSEKLKQLVEGIEYESDKDFATKVHSIRESYFGKSQNKPKILTEDRKLVGTDGVQSVAHPSMVTSIADSIRNQNSFGRK